MRPAHRCPPSLASLAFLPVGSSCSISVHGLLQLVDRKPGPGTDLAEGVMFSEATRSEAREETREAGRDGVKDRTREPTRDGIDDGTLETAREET